MKHGLKVAIAIVVILLAAGLFFLTYYPKLAQNILIPEIEHVKSADLRIEGDSIFARLDIRMHNSGIFKMNLDSIIYKINFDTMRVLSKQQDLSIVLKSGQADTFKLPVAIPFKRIKNRVRELQHRDSADITSDIRLVYKTVFGRVSLPHKKTTRIGMPVPPEYKIEKVEYLGRDKKVLSLLVHLMFHYKGSRVMQVSNITYRLKILDLIEAEGSVQKTINIIPDKPVYEQLPVSLDLKRPWKTAFKVVTDDDLVPYRLDIGLDFTSNEALDKTHIDISKEGKLELKK